MCSTARHHACHPLGSKERERHRECGRRGGVGRRTRQDGLRGTGMLQGDGAAALAATAFQSCAKNTQNTRQTPAGHALAPEACTGL